MSVNSFDPQQFDPSRVSTELGKTLVEQALAAARAQDDGAELLSNRRRGGDAGAGHDACGLGSGRTGLIDRRVNHADTALYLGRGPVLQLAGWREICRG